MKKLEAFYSDIINNLEDGIYFVDSHRKITLWNKAAERITGYTADEIIGRPCQDNILCHIDMEGTPLCLVGCPLFATLGDGEHRIAEVLLRHKDGHRIAILVKILPMYEDGEIIGAVEIFTPKTTIASDSQLVDSLTDKVMTDALTQLPNRMYLESFFDYKMQEFKRFGNFFCVLFLDIDNFSHFNNTYGHHIGDKVLQSIAQSFRQNLRDTDAMGRWGGEEFLGIFSIRNEREAAIVAEKVRLLVSGSEILNDDGERLHVTASIGVALAKPTDRLEGIVERADSLMYQSKKASKNCFHVENPDNPEKPFTSIPEQKLPPKED